MAITDRPLPVAAASVRRRGRWRRVQPRCASVQVIIRVLAMGAAALLLGAVRIPHRPATLCILRGATGIPCPLCGGTTCAVEAAHGHPLAGLLANPVVFIGAIIVATAPLTGVVRWWASMSGRTRTVLAITALVASEIWQLGRYGLLF